jgi:hypothetical protein
MDTKIKLYLKLQALAALAGIVTLFLFEFAGFYYYDAYYKMDVWGSSRMFAGAIPTIMMLIGVAGFVYAIYYAGKSLKEENKTTIQENTRKTIWGGIIAGGLAAIGGIVFVTTSLNTYWWFGPGFYGGVIGGAAVVYLGWRILKKIGK